MTTTLDINAAALAALRVPFPASVVGKLPRKTKGGGTIMLDFVGHATVTDRLLSVDPEWTWDFGCVDPASGIPSKEASIERDEHGRPVALWMALTVCGVTRRDVGYVEAGKDEPMKLLVSDALSRCAMRFGVALDLWAKDGLESQVGPAPAARATRQVDADTGEISTPTRRRPAPVRSTGGPSAGEALAARVNALADNHARAACMRALVAQFGSLADVTADLAPAAESVVAGFEFDSAIAGNGNGNGNGKAA